MSRPDWDTYFMNIAKVVATRATCDRKHVGAVLVRDRTILATGYNGASRGLLDCDTDGHLLEDKGGRMSCVRTIHAEINALVQAARVGVRVEGATLYTTASCCYDCAKTVINAGVVRVFAGEAYPGRPGAKYDTQALFASAGVESVVWASEPDCDVAELQERLACMTALAQYWIERWRDNDLSGDPISIAEEALARVAALRTKPKI